MYKDKYDERAKAARRKHYYANKQQYLDRNKIVKAKITELIRTTKTVPCMDCGKQYPHYVMDLDHRDPLTKKFEPARLASYGNMKAALVEIAKCDVVCSNCHRERTYGSQTGKAEAAGESPKFLSIEFDSWYPCKGQYTDVVG